MGEDEWGRKNEIQQKDKIIKSIKVQEAQEN